MNTQRRASQRGFTLVELVVVIIILGVLAAVAVPKFIDMSVDARNASAKGVAGAISSGSSINFAAKKAGNSAAVTLNAAEICTSTLLNSFITNGISLVSGTPAADDQFQISNTGSAGDCTAATGAVSAQCRVTPNGSGVTAQPVTVFCAR